jgi:hypothetical protein
LFRSRNRGWRYCARNNQLNPPIFRATGRRAIRGGRFMFARTYGGDALGRKSAAFRKIARNRNRARGREFPVCRVTFAQRTHYGIVIRVTFHDDLMSGKLRERRRETRERVATTLGKFRRAGEKMYALVERNANLNGAAPHLQLAGFNLPAQGADQIIEGARSALMFRRDRSRSGVRFLQRLRQTGGVAAFLSQRSRGGSPRGFFCQSGGACVLLPYWSGVARAPRDAAARNRRSQPADCKSTERHIRSSDITGLRANESRAPMDM